MLRDELSIRERFETIEQYHEALQLAVRSVDAKLHYDHADENDMAQALSNCVLYCCALARQLGIEPAPLFRQIARMAQARAAQEDAALGNDWATIAGYFE